MTDRAGDKPGRTPSWLYRQLDPAQTAAINANLVAAAAARHPGKLSAAQMADLTAAIEQQTRHLETLHRFPLSNADEPAFIRAPLGVAR